MVIQCLINEKNIRHNILVHLEFTVSYHGYYILSHRRSWHNKCAQGSCEKFVHCRPIIKAKLRVSS
jgi:hypothetical protein